jgi:hypothetical protein
MELVVTGWDRSFFDSEEEEADSANDPISSTEQMPIAACLAESPVDRPGVTTRIRHRRPRAPEISPKSERAVKEMLAMPMYREVMEHQAKFVVEVSASSSALRSARTTR